MSRRMLAGAAVVAAVLVVAGTPASAQTYPPPVRSITVDDTTPAPGQSIVVTLQTCRPGSTALVGIDLTLVGSTQVGADGVARATVTVPAGLRPGRHIVSGACLAPDLSPLFLTTAITVTAPGGGGGGTGTGDGTPGAVAPPSGDADGGQDAGVIGGTGAASLTPPGGAASRPGPRIPSSSLANLASLAAPEAPPDAPAVFDDLATANGVTVGDSTPPEATASRTPDGTGSNGSGPGTLSTLARVALGVVALGGVPVALAVSRRPQRVARRGFA